MSRNAHVDLEFAGEVRRFRLAIGELEELQEATACGPFWLLAKVLGDEGCGLSELREIVRCGLQGGGLGPSEAHGLVRCEITENTPTGRLTALAAVILSEALARPEGETLRARVKSEAALEEERLNGRLEFGDYYRNAAVLKLSVDDMRRMSLWQFAAYVDGHNRANDPNAEKTLAEGEEEALWEMVKAA